MKKRVEIHQTPHGETMEGVGAVLLCRLREAAQDYLKHVGDDGATVSIGITFDRDNTQTFSVDGYVKSDGFGRMISVGTEQVETC